MSLTDPISQNELFSKITPWKGDVPKGFSADFLGVLTRQEFVSPIIISAFHPGYFPSFDEDHYEWLDLLESISHARKSFTMVELGAGYGRWLVRAAFANRFFRNLPCKLIGVEAEPTHFRWLKQHFQDNNVNFEQTDLIQAAISDRDGKVWFNEGASDRWYGQRMLSTRDVGWQIKQRVKGRIKNQTPPEQSQTAGCPVYEIKRVPTISLKTLLIPLNNVDLIDIDIQGAEYLVLNSAKQDLSSKVARVHIATHNHEVECDLRILFGKLGWKNVFDFQLNSEIDTKWSKVKFNDGVQTWINPQKIEH